MRDDDPTLKLHVLNALCFSLKATTTGPSCSPLGANFTVHLELTCSLNCPKTNHFALPTIIFTIMPHSCSDCGRSYINKSLNRHHFHNNAGILVIPETELYTENITLHKIICFQTSSHWIHKCLKNVLRIISIM